MVKPTQDWQGELVCWKRPGYVIVDSMLANPGYGGAYVYGRSEKIVRYDDGEQRKATRRKPRERSLVLLPNAHEGYVSWEQFEQIQRTIAENNHGWQRVGAAHNGPALLAGLLRCGRCGRKLVVFENVAASCAISARQGHCTSPWNATKSKRAIRCPTAAGSSIGTHYKPRPPRTSFSAANGRSRYRTTNKKRSILQPHRKVGSHEASL
jgi:hypothetical protein